MVTLPVAKLQKVFKLQSNSRVPLLKKSYPKVYPLGQQGRSGSRVSWWTFPLLVRVPWRIENPQGRTACLPVNLSRVITRLGNSPTLTEGRAATNLNHQIEKADT